MSEQNKRAIKIQHPTVANSRIGTRLSTAQQNIAAPDTGTGTLSLELARVLPVVLVVVGSVSLRIGIRVITYSLF